MQKVIALSHLTRERSQGKVESTHHAPPRPVGASESRRHNGQTMGEVRGFQFSSLLLVGPIVVQARLR